MKRSHRLKQTLQYTTTLGAIALLTGCAATQVAMEHRTLDVSTKQSETIFLDPIPASQKTI